MKVILVTGASSGIGYMTAELLARKGNKVYGAARRIDLMKPLQSVGVQPIYMDVTDEASMSAAVNAILEKEGRIDVLINNAGYGSFGPLENVSIEEARRQFDVNVFGLAGLTQLVLPSMRHCHNGTIINVASLVGYISCYFGGWYNASKHAVASLSETLRMEVKPFGIHVSVIAPGGIKTNWGMIAADALRHSTEGTAYAHDASLEADVIQKGYSGGLLTSPYRVARYIAKAASSSHPRQRYRMGVGSYILPCLYRLLPITWWDALNRYFLTIRVRY
jgi:NAD(P)-dependent dehydrogenase (short-subunit alcohol dehydrogenase family)